MAAMPLRPMMASGPGCAPMTEHHQEPAAFTSARLPEGATGVSPALRSAAVQSAMRDLVDLGFA